VSADNNRGVRYDMLVIGFVIAVLIGLWLGPGRGVEDHSVRSTNQDPTFVLDTQTWDSPYNLEASVSIGAVVAAGAAESVVFLNQGRAPYGGCDEARPEYAWTAGWRWCVRHKQIIVTLRPCRQEDGPGPCAWDARHMGNGRGDSFIIRTRNGPIRYVSHRLAHVLIQNHNEYVR
jgi:hypothetical protein